MLIRNTHPEYLLPLDRADAELLGRDGAEEAVRHLALWPGYAPTPRHAMRAMAASLGIRSLHVKDEGARFGLGSFKALGGAYAVARLVEEEAEARIGRALRAGELQAEATRSLAQDMTFACATDGNHGRSVAWGAREAGARAVIWVHGGVSDERVDAIARYGAEIRRVEGTYDDSVAEAARVCEAEGWISLSDSSWPGYERIPGLVMQGYTALMHEMVEQVTEVPTHVFVQAGVGGLAAAMAAYVADVFSGHRPRVVVVEPARAACLLESARAGQRTRIAHGEPTVMAMLECYEPSLVAWRILARCADAFMTVGEDEAIAVMNRLARPLAGDPYLVAGESGGVGVAGLIAVASDPDAREAIGLDAGARVWAINTEGATDPLRYRELVRVDAELLPHVPDSGV